MQWSRTTEKWIILLLILTMTVAGTGVRSSEMIASPLSVAVTDVGTQRTESVHNVHTICMPVIHSVHDMCTGEHIGLRMQKGTACLANVRREKERGAKTLLRLFVMAFFAAVMPLLDFYIRMVVMRIGTDHGESRDSVIRYIHDQDGEKGCAFVNKRV